ncbi:ATP-binding protein [Stenotrophomonas maltophilia]|uniref:ATP-binding protein n=1 Tax=Stenotrophomonas maltophilia TaxID=40324 RepID=UPI00021E0B56|nr:ATP-binding protein [Stenotrophomonas maltophilia]AEM49542.1 hypothetical protein BurJV3_0207 [Stenotrophomonas maltophilia JV3]
MTSPTINASPTKEFFISIITKDISLLDAIKDLVDNCVDGARSMRPSGDYSGLSVHVEVKNESFLIVDNCGGFSVDTAVNYAFRFGRAKGAPSVSGSIGQFGVGMKRALFKMGKKFEVKSISQDSHFSLEVDLDEWTALLDENGREKWEFEFADVGENENNAEDSRGTTLQVTNLYPTVAAEFGTDLFVQVLVRSLQQAHARSLSNGLDIRVNNFELSHRIATLLQSDEIRPIRIERNFQVEDGDATSAVKLTLYAGIADSSLKEAGWYIICNGRQVVGADKTELTSWQSEVGGHTLPAAHGQFSRFRGYAIFESDNAKALPWNTSKSGIDSESKVFQSARMEMANALRQVIDFLNELDAERDGETSDLIDSVKESVPVPLSNVAISARFQAPSRRASIAKKPTSVRVQFTRSVEDVEFAKDHFNVSSASKAGEAAFDYFLDRERES